MNDYGGLGILVEDPEESTKHGVSPLSDSDPPHPASTPVASLHPDLTQDLHPHSSYQYQAITRNGSNNTDLTLTSPSSATSANGSESLLPPLPNEDDDLSQTVLSPTGLSMNNSPIVSTHPRFQHLMDDAESSTTVNSAPSIAYSSFHKEDSTNTTDLSDLFLDNPSYLNYELDSPNLKFDAKFQPFPSVSATQSMSSSTNLAALNSAPLPSASTTTNQSSTSNTSPIKRLKSLKNGIRKLSLSSSSNSSSSNTNANTPSSTLSSALKPLSLGPSRPNLSPLQTNAEEENNFQGHSHNSSHSSTNSSSSSYSSSSNPTGSTSTTAPSQTQSFNYLPFKSTRSRTLSNSTSLLTPLTPPLNSPIITLSENLTSSKRALSTLEQSYFDTLNSKFTNSMKEVFQNPFDSESTSRERVSSISELETAEDLIKYSIFLKSQKKSIGEAFEMTKQHLTQSGWCSDHDMNNLQLQQDSQFSQIVTKLLQIEQRLNEEFGMSLLNNPETRKRSAKSSLDRVVSLDGKDLPISPSLKTLESRCFSFIDI